MRIGISIFNPQFFIQIVCDFLHKMHSILAPNIVLMGGIWKIVQLDFGLYASLNKAKAVFPDYGVVNGSLTYQ